MQIKKLGSGRYADIAIDGSTVTVAGTSVDCKAEQRDSQAIITVWDGDSYAAVVEIPPRKYRMEDGEKDGEKVMEKVAIPLENDAVSITLWPVANIIGEER